MSAPRRKPSAQPTAQAIAAQMGALADARIALAQARSERDALADAAGQALAWLENLFTHLPAVTLLNHLPNGSSGREALRDALTLVGRPLPQATHLEFPAWPCPTCKGSGQRKNHKLEDWLAEREGQGGGT